VAVLALLLGTAACGARATEDQARGQVEDMAGSPLMQATAGGAIQTTRRDVCGGGSVAPYVDRSFKGDAALAEPEYRRLAVRDGWHVEPDSPGGVDGFVARKGDRTFGFRRSAGGWVCSCHRERARPIAISQTQTPM
jgi:hypothetical protein